MPPTAAPESKQPRAFDPGPCFCPPSGFPDGLGNHFIPAVLLPDLVRLAVVGVVSRDEPVVECLLPFTERQLVFDFREDVNQLVSHLRMGADHGLATDKAIAATMSRAKKAKTPSRIA